MTFQLPEFYFKAGAEIQEYCHTFFETHGLNYFQFCTVHKDGRHSSLVNRMDFLNHRFHSERGVVSHIDGENIDRQTFMFLWDHNLPDEDTDQARLFNINHGICFAERYEDVYYLNAFGVPENKKNPLNFYLNNIGLLKNFIDTFKVQAKDLIDESIRQAIHLPKGMKDPNADNMWWDRKHQIPLRLASGQSIFMSPQESQTLKLLSQGKTMKASALHMNISPRTVETYLNRLKDKTGLFKKSDLVALFLSQYSV